MQKQDFCQFSDHIFITFSDDGGGMDPQAMRHCMGFGFSDKKSDSAIGRCMNPSLCSSNRIFSHDFATHISIYDFAAKSLEYDSVSHSSL